MTVSEAKRLKALEDEHAKLKRLLAEQMLGLAAMKELLSKNGDARREARGCRASEGPSWAVGTAGVSADCRGGPARWCATSRSAPRTRRCEGGCGICQRARRFGYRRLFVQLRREGEPSGLNRLYRLYREEGLTVRKRKARRKSIGTRAPILIEARAKARWSLDFVHDRFACGRRRFRVLNVVDGNVAGVVIGQPFDRFRQAVEQSEATLDGHDHEVAHIFALDAFGGRDMAYGLAVAAVERESDPNLDPSNNPGI